jgi:hypothetical protein
MPRTAFCHGTTSRVSATCRAPAWPGREVATRASLPPAAPALKAIAAAGRAGRRLPARPGRCYELRIPDLVARSR